MICTVNNHLTDCHEPHAYLGEDEIFRFEDAYNGT